MDEQTTDPEERPTPSDAVSEPAEEARSAPEPVAAEQPEVPISFEAPPAESRPDDVPAEPAASDDAGESADDGEGAGEEGAGDEGQDGAEEDTSDDTSDDDETSDDTSDDTSEDTSEDEDAGEETGSSGTATAEDDAPAEEHAATEAPAALDPELSETTAEPVAVDDELAAEVESALEGVIEDEALGDWFVVHTYAGYENKVKANLETRVHSMNMEESIFEVVIPMEKVTEMKGGKKTTVDRKVFPGYLLVRMDLNDDSWYVVRNTPGVTGFVGSGTKPIPLSPKEVDKILARKAAEEPQRPKAEWQPNEPVRVTTGPFANFQGVVSDIDMERSKLKVLVNIFGRETPVELGFDQVAKV